MPQFTEKSIGEDYFVEKLQEKGWRFVPVSDGAPHVMVRKLLLGELDKNIHKNEDAQRDKVERGGKKSHKWLYR
jgi:hypothetical protein